jgi:uncharacterized protein
MSREFPDLLDPWKAADGRRSFQGTMPVRRMRRLTPLLAPENGDGAMKGTVRWPDVAFNVRFGHDEQGTVTVDLRVEAELPLICQRSLEPYVERIARHSLLAVVESVAEQEGLPEHYEPVLVESGRMALVDLVEDELLLGLPQVPRNPAVAEIGPSAGEAGEAAAADEREPTHRPFAGLAGLLKKRSGE